MWGGTLNQLVMMITGIGGREGREGGLVRLLSTVHYLSTECTQTHSNR